MADIAQELRNDFPAVDVTTVVFSRDFAGVGCCVIPQGKVLEIIEELESLRAKLTMAEVNFADLKDINAGLRKQLELRDVLVERTADLTDEQIEDLRSHIRGAQPGQDTYEYELGSGWRCFHCGEMFRTWGGASLHFGRPADKRPVCTEFELPSTDGDRG
jgi:hypothetical protein